MVFPVPLIEPRFTVQVTAVFEEPVTVAVKLWEVPTAIDAVDGRILTETAPEPDVTGVVVADIPVPFPPQLITNKQAAKRTNGHPIFDNFMRIS
jgi:hypothetical protein